MRTITSRPASFRRCGKVFTATPAEFKDDAFTPAQWAILENEPNLVVVSKPEPKSEPKPEPKPELKGKEKSPA